MARHKVHMIWFAHQPFFVPDDELIDRVYSTYFPILDIHAERKIPVSFGITGGTLERVSRLVPAFLPFLKGLVRYGWVDCIGTAAFHPLLPELDRYWIDRQLEFDKELKGSLELPVLPVFWPTELAWSQRIAGPLLHHGYKFAVVDSRCVDKRNSWPNWEMRNYQLVPKPPSAANIARHTKLSLALVGEQRHEKLEIISRDSPLSNGLVSIVHNNEGYAAKLAELGALMDQQNALSWHANQPIVLGEDPERVLPERLGEYLVLLDGLVEQGTEFLSIQDILECPATTKTRHVPAGTMQGDARIWNTSLEDKWYRQQLGNLDRQFQSWARTSGEKEVITVEKDFMKIQDSGFYFWPFIARTRAPFYETMADIEEMITSRNY